MLDANNISMSDSMNPKQTEIPAATAAVAAASGTHGTQDINGATERSSYSFARTLEIGHADVNATAISRLLEIQQKQNRDLAEKKARLADIKAKNEMLKQKKEADAKLEADKICNEIFANKAQLKQLEEEEAAELTKNQELEKAEYTSQLVLLFAAKQLESSSAGSGAATTELLLLALTLAQVDY